MKHSLFIIATIPLISNIAFAADLPSRGAPPVFDPAPVTTWTGFYIGANAGYTFSSGGQISNTAANIFSIPVNGNIGQAVASNATGLIPGHDDGGLLGGQIGYNRQFDAFVGGVEADIGDVVGTRENGYASSVGIVPGAVGPPTGIPSAGLIAGSRSLDYLGTIRGRLGYLVLPSLLVYATGGVAYGHVSASTSTTSLIGFPDTPFPFSGVGATSYSSVRVGATVGGGLEWMFLPNWSLKAEYLYYTLGRASVATTIPQFGVDGALLETINEQTSSVRFDGHIVRVGLNYHFNWDAPAPVVAKY